MEHSKYSPIIRKEGHWLENGKPYLRRQHKHQQSTIPEHDDRGKKQVMMASHYE